MIFFFCQKFQIKISNKLNKIHFQLMEQYLIEVLNFSYQIPFQNICPFHEFMFAYCLCISKEFLTKTRKKTKKEQCLFLQLIQIFKLSAKKVKLLKIGFPCQNPTIGPR